VFGIKAACLFDAADAEVYIAGNASDNLEKKTGEAFISWEGLRVLQYVVPVLSIPALLC
jgi:hypothetical protein